MQTLEQMLRRRQDELRGRPESGVEQCLEWVRSIDWGWVGFVACVSCSELLYAAAEIARYVAATGAG